MTRRWLIPLGLLTAAGLADAGSWLLVPVELRRHDLSPLRVFADAPLVPFVYKGIVIALCAALAHFDRSRIGQAVALAIMLLGAAFWTFGAWSNVAHGWYTPVSPMTHGTKVLPTPSTIGGYDPLSHTARLLVE